MLHILILSTSNATVGQMTHGFLDYYTSERAQIYSAGVNAKPINPKAIEVMDTVGIDISEHTSQNIDELENISFNYVITIGKDLTSHIPKKSSAATIIDFPIEPLDDAKSDEDHLKKYRKKIHSFCEKFIDAELQKIELSKPFKKAKKAKKKKKQSK